MWWWLGWLVVCCLIVGGFAVVWAWSVIAARAASRRAWRAYRRSGRIIP